MYVRHQNINCSEFVQIQPSHRDVLSYRVTRKHLKEHFTRNKSNILANLSSQPLQNCLNMLLTYWSVKGPKTDVNLTDLITPKFATKQRSDVLKVKCPFNLFQSVVNVCVSDNQATCVNLLNPPPPNTLAHCGWCCTAAIKTPKTDIWHGITRSPLQLSLLCSIELLTCWCLCKKRKSEVWMFSVVSLVSVPPCVKMLNAYILLKLYFKVLHKHSMSYSKQTDYTGGDSTRD